MFLRSVFRVVMSVMISAYKRHSVILYLQLFVGGLMSCLCYLCLFVYSGVQHILCCVFVLFFFVLCTYVASFSGLSIFDCPSIFSNIYLLYIHTLYCPRNGCLVPVINMSSSLSNIQRTGFPNLLKNEKKLIYIYL